MIRGIILDCFGVLYVDASKVYFANFPKLHDELYDLNKLSDHGFIGKDDYITSVAKITGVSEAETADAFQKEYVINDEIIDWLKRDIKPHFKIALLSNIGRGWIQDFFDEHQLHDLFDVVVLSGEEGVTKPNPIIFERAAERLGLEPYECLMVDDRQDNVEGAQTAGMQGVLFVSNHQLKEAVRAVAAEKEIL
ncbi:MAG TPA: HAD-IA family hydrolase [Candidatus Saccharimonadales bacterium]|nr:HAD-IA family hydrolase [Candidatus Saccharimonadales bacterium]